MLGPHRLRLLDLFLAISGLVAHLGGRKLADSQGPGLSPMADYFLSSLRARTAKTLTQRSEHSYF